MKYIRDDVEINEFNSLSQIEKELLYKIHMKQCDGEPVPFEYIVASFRPRYSFDDITKTLNELRAKKYLYQKSFFESTFQNLEYSNDMEEL